jgi:hypothetical protein
MLSLAISVGPLSYLSSSCVAKSGEKAGLVAAYSRIGAYCPNVAAIAFPVMPTVEWGMTHTDLVKLLRADLCSFVLARSNPVSLDLPAYQRISADIDHFKNLSCFGIKSQLICVKDVHDQVRRMQACKLIMFHDSNAYTHALSGIWSGSATNCVSAYLEKGPRLGHPSVRVPKKV